MSAPAQPLSGDYDYIVIGAGSAGCVVAALLPWRSFTAPNTGAAMPSCHPPLAPTLGVGGREPPMAHAIRCIIDARVVRVSAISPNGATQNSSARGGVPPYHIFLQRSQVR